MLGVKWYSYNDVHMILYGINKLMTAIKNDQSIAPYDPGTWPQAMWQISLYDHFHTDVLVTSCKHVGGLSSKILKHAMSTSYCV